MMLSRSSRFGFPWLVALSLRKPCLLTLGFVWISLDSLVRNETYQGLHWIFAEKIFCSLSTRKFASGRRETPILEGESARTVHKGKLSLISDFLQDLVV
jgi:hypothetical protein